MRRTKEWWAMLKPYERTRLWHLERMQWASSSSAYLPYGYGDCPMCSTPSSGGGLCMSCLKEWIRIVHKPVRLLIRKRAYEIAARNGWPPRRAKYLAQTGNRKYVRSVISNGRPKQ